MTIEHYEQLAAWTSTAGTGPTLRGRRHDRNGPMLHFMSGNGFCGGVYWPMLRSFTADYGLFTHDIEGQGDSDAPERFSGVGALIERIPQVMADQGLVGRPLIGMGHSFGSLLTLRVAAAHPGLFKALVLLDPVAFPPAVFFGLKAASLLGRHPLSGPTRRRRDRWPSRQAVADSLRGRGAFKHWTEEALQCFARYAIREESGECRLACPKELEAQIFESPVWPWRAFREVKVPVLLLRGTGSYEFFPRTEALARRANPEIVLRQLPGWHCFMQENPAAAAQAVQDFLRTLRD